MGPQVRLPLGRVLDHEVHEGVALSGRKRRRGEGKERGRGGHGRRDRGSVGERRVKRGEGKERRGVTNSQ